ncbi:hypothetical protein GGTG_07699 [Gaeumannomyces tritici R3-111a-1]|uniref:Uncharacterized protein n=1 Tax=Gaeumannomyces tritici (strain R3-111a-1) TaxID=644352 RepID=J3P2F2_GAET3|nr:hypothetical protein GGTG_07699 [Gaeumannomyces tritici R3-111a-1]EJT73844.1 hypothetical protein GGTG_07699 [Gaeumannomyces tritici R3-111a-1]
MPNIRPFPKVAGRSDGDAAIEQRNPRKNNGGNRPPGGPGRLDKITIVLDTTLPWAQLVNQQQQPPPAKRSVDAEVERREPNRGRPGKPNNNQQPGGPGKVDTITNPQKRSDAPSDAEIADMLEAAAAGYLDERQAQVVRRAVVAAILA